MDDEFAEATAPWARTWRGRQVQPCASSFKTSDRIPAVRRGGTYIDATWFRRTQLGNRNPPGRTGHLIGFDKDPAALERTRERLTQPRGDGDGLAKGELVHASFAMWRSMWRQHR